MSLFAAALIVDVVAGYTGASLSRPHRPELQAIAPTVRPARGDVAEWQGTTATHGPQILPPLTTVRPATPDTTHGRRSQRSRRTSPPTTIVSPADHGTSGGNEHDSHAIGNEPTATSTDTGHGPTITGTHAPVTLPFCTGDAPDTVVEHDCAPIPTTTTTSTDAPEPTE